MMLLTWTSRNNLPHWILLIIALIGRHLQDLFRLLPCHRPPGSMGPRKKPVKSNSRPRFLLFLRLLRDKVAQHFINFRDSISQMFDLGLHVIEIFGFGQILDLKSDLGGGFGLKIS